MLNILCGLVGHHRSKRHRKPAAGVWTSQCALCRTRMERIGPGQWLPVADLANPGAQSQSRMPAAAD